jgi:hypothetical protein
VNKFPKKCLQKKKSYNISVVKKKHGPLCYYRNSGSVVLKTQYLPPNTKKKKKTKILQTRKKRKHLSKSRLNQNSIHPQTKYKQKQPNSKDIFMS